MAQEKATLWIKIKQTGQTALGKLPKILGAIGKAGLVAGTAIVGFVAGVAKMAGMSAQFDAVKRAFTNLATTQGQDADKMLAKMRELSRGTVSDMKLMQSANQALLLGLPVDRFGDMLEIARSASQATGESMDFMLNSIVTGLGRGSKLMLDNLGIVFKIEDAYSDYAKANGKLVSSLTEAEKKQAFINKALAVGVENAKAAGSSNLTLSERIQQVKASFQNLSIVIGQKVAPALSFFLDEGQTLFASIEKWVTSSSATSFFKNLTKAIAIGKNAFVAYGQTIGTIFTGIFFTMANAMSGNFKAAASSIKTTLELIKDDAIKNKNQLETDLASIDEKFKAAEVERVVNTEMAKKIAREKARIEKQQELETADEMEMERLIAQKEAENELIGATEEQKNDIMLRANAKAIQTATNHDKKMELLKKRAVLLDQKQELQQTEIKKKELEAREAAMQSSLSRISRLQTANSKTLATIGKAAAIAQIMIDTPVAITKALTAGPIIGPILAAGIAAQAGQQLAAVHGVQLAEGGVVMPRPGGVQATIGEGGQREAVIPLPDGMDIGNLGGGMQITFTGPVLGDENQAREFAVMLDRQLLELRRSNESVSFDEEVV